MMFKGIGKNISKLLIFPLFIELSTIVLISYLYYGMPTEVAYTFAFTMAPVSSTMVLPTMLKMMDEKIGTHKLIP